LLNATNLKDNTALIDYINLLKYLLKFIYDFTNIFSRLNVNKLLPYRPSIDYKIYLIEKNIYKLPYKKLYSII